LQEALGKFLHGDSFIMETLQDDHFIGQVLANLIPVGHLNNDKHAQRTDDKFGPDTANQF